MVIAANLSFSDRASMFGDAKTTTALLTLHRRILETGNDSVRFKASAASSKTGKEIVQSLTKPETRGT